MKAGDEITLEEWAREKRDDVDRFRRHWAGRQSVAADMDYPERMLPGDWDEQFEVFCEHRKEEHGEGD